MRTENGCIGCFTKFSILSFGFIAITISSLSYTDPVLNLILTLMAEIFDWDYQSNRGVWEKLHRELAREILLVKIGLNQGRDH